jgi:diamine N-acetyltransferase
MIDASFQGQGYGKASMKKIIEQMKAMTNIAAIRISFDPDNDSARALYLKMGFLETGEIEDDEVIFEMRLV